ncbi:MAG: ATP-binding protein [Sandaracinaceae bacterium]
MDLRSQTSLLAAVLSFAIASTVLIRGRRRRVHWYFSLFGVAVGAWYASTFLARVFHQTPLWPRVNLVCAMLLPLGAMTFFRAFLQGDTRRATQVQSAGLVVALLMGAAVFTPLFHQKILTGLIFTYVFVLLSASLVMVYNAARRAPSRAERARLTYLVVVGALAAVFTLAEFLPYAGLEIPPVGTVLILVFLYVLSQSILRYRLPDLYELAGRLTLLTALSFSLAGILWVLVFLDPGHFFLHSVVAALVLFLLADPVRAKLEQTITQFFLRERHALERVVVELRKQLAHTLSMEDLNHVLISGLGASRRITDASIYLLDDGGSGFDLGGHVGMEPIKRVEAALSRPLFDRLRRDEVLVLDVLERDLDAARELGEDLEAELLTEIIASLSAMRAAVCIALRGADETYGLLCVRDDRLADAFSPEEVQLLRGLAAQASIAIENSRLYQRLKQRDRLAALGGMAAGLAHEIRNPLGAIKASAQFLAERPEEEEGGTEFLDIIVEEVDRLNRVVSSFLDYARPSTGDPIPTEINGVVQRTVQILSPDLGDVSVKVHLADELPRVRIDAERLRQVLINLGQNAAQAMEGRGELNVKTGRRWHREPGGARKLWVELEVSDTGPGIPERVRANLFVPFVTTKDRGTGLGLAISQRIVNTAGGHIEVRSLEGVGTTFVVRLPAVDEREPTGPTTPSALQSASNSLGAKAGASTPEGITPPRDVVGAETPTSVASSR